MVGDGKQRTVFEASVANLGLERKFLFLGRRADAGLPNAVLEYMTAGLPVIASKVGGSVELIEEGVTGLLVPAENSPALSAALLRLLHDEDLAKQLAQNGHEFAVRNFSFERLVTEVDSLYTELLSRRGDNR